MRISTAGSRLTSHVSLIASGTWRRPCLQNRPRSNTLLDLPEFQFDRRRAAEDRHRDLDARAALVDLLDGAVERSERPVRDADLLADFERHRRLRPVDALLHLLQDALRLGFRDRHRLVVGAEEAGDLRRVLDEMVGLVGEVHLHQHVAREELALGVDLAAAAHLGDLFLRHQDLVEQVVEPALLGLLADGFRDLVLEVRVGVDDVPALWSCASIA